MPTNGNILYILHIKLIEVLSKLRLIPFLSPFTNQFRDLLDHLPWGVRLATQWPLSSLVWDPIGGPNMYTLPIADSPDKAGLQEIPPMQNAPPRKRAAPRASSMQNIRVLKIACFEDTST
jgi:hypothetical protein